MTVICTGTHNCPYYLECLPTFHDGIWEIDRCLLDEEAQRIIAEDKKEVKE